MWKILYVKLSDWVAYRYLSGRISDHFALSSFWKTEDKDENLLSKTRRREKFVFNFTNKFLKLISLSMKT